MPVRLQKAIADAGLCARRTAEGWILAGRVAVNGQVVTALGSKADPATDTITVDGRPIPRVAARGATQGAAEIGETSTGRAPPHTSTATAKFEASVRPEASARPESPARPEPLGESPTGDLREPRAVQESHDVQEQEPRVAQEYWALNKPAGVVSTWYDPQGRPTLRHLLHPHTRTRLFPVGRLDADSEGLVLLTNDGELTHRLTHPSFGHEKEYHVQVDRVLAERDLATLRAGIVLDEHRTAPAVVEPFSPADQGREARPRDRQGARTQGRERPTVMWLRIVLREGRKRQIRRMVAAVGGRVLALRRARIGPLMLGDLPSGQARRLTDAEVAELRRTAGVHEDEGGPQGAP